MATDIAATTPFGRRHGPSLPEAPDQTAPENWPFVSKNTAVKRMLPFIFGAGLVFITQILPAILESKNLDSFVAQSGMFDVLVFLALAAVIVLGLRWRFFLTIGSEGIVFLSGRKTWQYAWADIDRWVETTNGVQLILKGRSDAQNQNNLLPANVGLTKAQLGTLLDYGVRNFSASQSLQTIAQGDDLRASRSTTFKVLGFVLGVPFLLIMGISANIFLGSAYDASRLQRTGASADAQVTRIFTGDCGKRTCAILADYSFVARDPKTGGDKQYSSTQRIGSDRDQSDPLFLKVRSTLTLPIVYDRNKPQFSRENLNNRIFAEHPWKRAIGRFWDISGFTLLLFGGLAVFMIVSVGLSRRSAGT